LWNKLEPSGIDPKNMISSDYIYLLIMEEMLKKTNNGRKYVNAY
jgi:hypothetical protein